MAQKTNNAVSPKTASKPKGDNDAKMALTWDNYKWMLIGLGVIILGFILMGGSSNNDPAVFNEKIFSFRRITLAPIFVLTGFAIEIFAIMKKPRAKK